MLGCVATIGFFDGVHRGHRFLIEQVCEVAAERGLSSALITFSSHPRLVMHPDFHPELLTTHEEKMKLLSDTAIDRFIVLDFTLALSQYSAREFMGLLKEKYDVKVLVVGYDHRFGHQRCETFPDYVRHGNELGMEVLLARAYLSEREEADKTSIEIPISSSYIREQLRNGDVKGAATYLGRNYSLRGRVISGRGEGRIIGFPTANIAVDEPFKLIPGNGVYVVGVELEGQRRGGILNIGCHPTFGAAAERSIEVYILDFNGDIYGRFLRIFFLHRHRSEQKFDTVDSLVETLRQDVSAARLILQAHGY